MFLDLRKFQLLSKINILSSYFFFVSVIAFLLIILTSTKFFSIDPSYSPGGSESNYLLPMLISFFLGCITFGVTILSGLLRRILNSEKWQAPFGIGAEKITLASILLIAFSATYMIGAIRGGVSFGGSYTGQEIFNEVNKHREKVGVKPVLMGEYLCDNLIERWKMAKAGKYHEGFEEWVKNEGIQTDYGYKEVGEILVSSSTPRDAVYWWSTSPGHKSTMEDSRWTDGCAYAAEGTAVMVFSYK